MRETYEEPEDGNRYPHIRADPRASNVPAPRLPCCPHQWA